MFLHQAYKSAEVFYHQNFVPYGVTLLDCFRLISYKTLWLFFLTLYVDA